MAGQTAATLADTTLTAEGLLLAGITGDLDATLANAALASSAGAFPTVAAIVYGTNGVGQVLGPAQAGTVVGMRSLGSLRR